MRKLLWILCCIGTGMAAIGWLASMIYGPGDFTLWKIAITGNVIQGVTIAIGMIAW